MFIILSFLQAYCASDLFTRYTASDSDKKLYGSLNNTGTSESDSVAPTSRNTTYF